MLTTQEVRWFFKGLLPPGVMNWFYQADPKPAGSAAREDLYLRLPESQTLGVKVREGRIEIKQRLQDFGVVNLHERVAGYMEQWRKWGFALVEDVETIPQLGQSAEWIGVAKERRLRKYEITKTEAVGAIPIDLLVARGCAAELGEIRVAGETWWSLCFEAFGEIATLQDNLLRVAAHVFQGEGTPRLEAKDSLSYPGWLSRLNA